MAKELDEYTELDLLLMGVDFLLYQLNKTQVDTSHLGKMLVNQTDLGCLQEASKTEERIKCEHLNVLAIRALINLITRRVAEITQTSSVAVAE